MSKFIYVFENRAKKDLLKRGYTLIREDKDNQLWIFENKDPEELEFSADYQVVLSNVLSF